MTVITNAATKEIAGSDHVEQLTYVDRQTNREATLAVEGVFILIGLMPNTEWLKDRVALNERNEIIVDKHGTTDLAGVLLPEIVQTVPTSKLLFRWVQEQQQR